MPSPAKALLVKNKWNLVCYVQGQTRWVFCIISWCAQVCEDVFDLRALERAECSVQVQ